MALRKIKNRWYVYYKEKGHIHTISTKCTYREDAEKFERDFMRKVFLDQSRERLKQFCGDLIPKQPEYVVRAQNEDKSGNRKGLKLADMFETASKYRALSQFHKRALERFRKETGLIYASETTPKIAVEFLRNNFGDKNGKTFNNYKTYLNTIFKLCLVESGMEISPFDKVLNMRITKTEAHRRITVEEFRKLFSAAKEPWKTALLISWHTGLRMSSCFSLAWSEIKDGAIVKLPEKTARFRRFVYIPIHEELMKHLRSLPKPREQTDPILSVYSKGESKRISGGRIRYITNLFKSQGVLDSEDGKASFHSLRVSFVTRCEEAGIPRSAIRGMVGHVADEVTDTYSQDKETPKQILSLPGSLETKD